MRIYFSGIGGVGVGPLAEIARDAGYDICGSDKEPGLMTDELLRGNVTVSFDQSGDFLEKEHQKQPFDWLVYTAALPDMHPELVYARTHGIRTSKRDEFLAHVIRDKNLKLLAVTGTHGKTTTTGMLIWAMKQLGIPVSYSIGTTLTFGPSGSFDPESEYFVYECDEFDRNFLYFSPWLSIITALDYDHPDTYPTIDEYRAAFVQFLAQSRHSLLWEKDLRYLMQPDVAADYEAFDELMDVSRFTLAGVHNRHNAFLVERALEKITTKKSCVALNTFPGTARRFEKIVDNLYSDYGHHTTEITATLQMARELSDDVVLVYQPHQNVRQYEMHKHYIDEVFAGARELYWLPTYLTRENPELPVLTPAQLTKNLTKKINLHFAEMNDQLRRDIDNARARGALVLCMGAGTIDDWVRKRTPNQS